MGNTAAGRDADRWERDERVLWRDAPGVTIILGPNDENPIAMRGTALALWAALDEPRTMNEIIELLMTHYHAARELIRADIEPALNRLAKSGALRRAP